MLSQASMNSRKEAANAKSGLTSAVKSDLKAKYSQSTASLGNSVKVTDISETLTHSTQSSKQSKLLGSAGVPYDIITNSGKKHAYSYAALNN